MEQVFIALLVIASLVIIVATLMMEPVSKGVTGYGQETNVFGKSAHRSKEQLLRRVTIVSAVVFVISSILIAVF